MEKKKLSRRDFLRSMAVTGAGLALSACATPTPQVVKETVVVEKEVEKVVTTEVEKVVTTEVEKVVTATPETFEVVNLTMWNSDPADYQAGYNAMRDQFNAMQDRIVVEMVVIPDSFNEKLLAGIAADDGPDCWMGGGMNADDVQQGHIAVVDPYIDANFVREDWWFPMAWEDSTYEGKQYGMPRDIGWGVWAYNADIFDAKGMPYPEIGWSQQDFIDTCVAITDKDAGIWGTAATGPGALLWGTAGYTWNMGFKTMSDDSKEVVGYLDSENSIRCIQHILDLQVELEVAPAASAMEAYGGSSGEMFYSGMIALGDGGTWEIDRQLARPFNWGFCEPPISEWGNNERWTWGDSVPYAMWSNGKQKDNTFEWLMFISGPKGSIIPHRIGSWTSPCPAVWEATKDEMDPRFDWLASQQDIPTGRFPFDYRFFWDCVSGPYWDIWTRYVELGERPLEMLVHEAAEDAQICLDDAWANV